MGDTDCVPLPASALQYDDDGADYEDGENATAADGFGGGVGKGAARLSEIPVKDVVIVLFMLSLWGYSIFLIVRAWAKVHQIADYNLGSGMWKFVLDYLRKKKEGSNNNSSSGGKGSNDDVSVDGTIADDEGGNKGQVSVDIEMTAAAAPPRRSVSSSASSGSRSSGVRGQHSSSDKRKAVAVAVDADAAPLLLRDDAPHAPEAGGKSGQRWGHQETHDPLGGPQIEVTLHNTESSCSIDGYNDDSHSSSAAVAAPTTAAIFSSSAAEDEVRFSPNDVLRMTSSELVDFCEGRGDSADNGNGGERQGTHWTWKYETTM